MYTKNHPFTEQDVLYLFYIKGSKAHAMILPRVMDFYKWEADVLCLSTNRTIGEFEIKCDKQDFRSEFINGTAGEPKKRKHKKMSSLQPDSSTIPNHYWIVCANFFPGDEIQHINKKYGLIQLIAEPVPRFKIIRQAKALHKEPLAPEGVNTLIEKAYNRYWNFQLKAFKSQFEK